MVVASLLATAYYFGRDNPARVAAKVDRSLFDNDADGVWMYIPDSEKNAVGITKEQFGRFLREYYLPAFAVAGMLMSVRVEAFPLIPGAYLAKRTFRSSVGGTVESDVAVEPTDVGPRTVDLLGSLPLAAMNVRHPKLPGDQFAYDQEVRAIRADAPVLNQLGVRGFQVQGASGKTFQTWGTRLAWCEDRLRAIRNQPRP